jgi:hypothetical protein
VADLVIPAAPATGPHAAVASNSGPAVLSPLSRRLGHQRRDLLGAQMRPAGWQTRTLQALPRGTAQPTSCHQRDTLCVKGWAGACAVVGPCIAVTELVLGSV